mmetsp:Transcript_141915/g.272544  ORF Transcript_141915/g.272544 Transcript_141915/m.272544 type:complete len:202 (+) Transcript_141915:1454-2059(+)
MPLQPAVPADGVDCVQSRPNQPFPSKNAQTDHKEPVTIIVGGLNDEIVRVSNKNEGAAESNEGQDNITHAPSGNYVIFSLASPRRDIDNISVMKCKEYMAENPSDYHSTQCNTYGLSNMNVFLTLCWSTLKHRLAEQREIQSSHAEGAQEEHRIVHASHVRMPNNRELAQHGNGMCRQKSRPEQLTAVFEDNHVQAISERN